MHILHTLQNDIFMHVTNFHKFITGLLIKLCDSYLCVPALYFMYGNIWHNKNYVVLIYVTGAWLAKIA